MTTTQEVLVKVLRGFVVQPGEIAVPGQTLRLPAHTARLYESQGRVAVVNEEPEQPGPGTAPDKVRSRDPRPMQRDPQRSKQ